MYKWKKILCKLQKVAGFTTSCLRGTPQKFFGLMRVCLQRRAFHILVQQQRQEFLKSQISYQFSSSSSLEKDNQQRFKTLQSLKSNDFSNSIQSYLSEIDQSILNLLKIDLKSLQKLSKYLSFSVGKHSFAMNMLLFAKSLGQIIPQQVLFAQVIQLTNFGASLHYSLQGQSEKPSDLQQFIGKKGIILGGDYLISNASIQCCKIKSMPLMQLLCVIIQNIAKGVFIKPVGDSVFNQLEAYCEQAMSKSAGMMANGCKGIAFLAGGDIKSAFKFGKEVGMALNVVKDLGQFFKGNLGVNSFPVLLADDREVVKFVKEGKVQQAKQMAIVRDGVEKTRQMALFHLEAAVKSLEGIASNQDLVSSVASISDHLYQTGFVMEWICKAANQRLIKVGFLFLSVIE